MNRRFVRIFARLAALPLVVGWAPCEAQETTVPGASTASGAGLTLEDAVKLALASNERARKAPLRVEAAEGSLERARAAFLPSIVASGTGTYRPVTDRNGRNLAGAGAVSLSQPLVNLSAIALHAQARHQLESERWGAQQDLRVLAFDTGHAFLLAKTNEQLLEAGKRRLERAQENQRDTEARAEAQLSSTNDVTRTVIETASAETQVAQIQGNLDRAYAQLAFLVGRPVAGPLTAPQRTTQAAEGGTFRMQDVLRFAESKRPDLKSEHERTAALHASADEPLLRLAPTLNASATTRETVAPIAPDAAHDESAQLTLTWTIYDGGARYGDRKTRVAQARSQELDEQLLKRSIATDIEIALSNLRAARRAYQVSEQAAVAARRNTEETAILYKQGLARAIELTDANAARFDAEAGIETAKLSMEQAYLDLREALGLNPTGDDLQGLEAGSAPATPVGGAK